MRQRDQFQTSLKQLYLSLVSIFHLSFNLLVVINPLSASVALIQKPINLLINGLTWIYNKNKRYEISDCCSRYMFNFGFLKKQEQFLRHILCIIFLKKYLSFHALLTDPISLFDCLYYFLRCLAVCESFVSQFATS